MTLKEQCHEIHPLLAQGSPRHLGLPRRDRRDAHPHRPRGRRGRGQDEDLCALYGRLCDLGRAAPQCRSPARVHGRYRQRHADPGGLRRAECPHRHEERVRAPGHLYSGQEHHARHRHHPRRRERGHAVLGRGARDLRRSRRHHRSAGRCAGRPALRDLCRPRRSGDRDQPHAEPSRLHLDPRHRPRSGCGRPRHAQGRRGARGCGERRVPGFGDSIRATGSCAPPSRCVSCAA